ncbi:pantetheine-phosphate adenylyltransferase [Cetobacterium sp.]|uniref:pantetheine-phosphate adenylyltransferase n=1 Tax=Cetobacterium sp. TaxID=2071632 RepID=UPI0025F96B73|nr:pantetheine-phosphate adenylyltransferase [uncultured Cetobacterium sp.]
MKLALYSGTFDPITKGHSEIIKRASKMCDKLIVAVLNNSAKKTMFTLEERKDMVCEVLKDIENVEVVEHSGLLATYMKDIGCNYIVRGLRAVTDYEYELSLAYGNYDISNKEIETIFIPASKEYLYVSSSIVRELALYDGKLDNYLDEYVIERIKKRVKE